MKHMEAKNKMSDIYPVSFILHENCTLIQTSPKLVRTFPVNNKPIFCKMVAWRLVGYKPKCELNLK